MSTNIWLTDEDSPIAGYKRARVGRRSDAASLSTAVAVTGPSSPIALQEWITDPLSAASLTAAAWTVHAWAKMASGSAAALRLDVHQFTNAEATVALLSYTGTTALGTTYKDVAFTTGNATVTSLASGDRLVFRLTADDQPTMGVGSVTLYYNGVKARAIGDSYILCPNTICRLVETPNETLTATRYMLKDTDLANPLLSDDDITQAIEVALSEYSTDRPQVAVQALSGDGATHDFALPSQWISDFSRILSVEYPVGDNPAAYVDDEAFGLYVSVSEGQVTQKLRFLSAPVSGTDNVYVAYTTRHVHDTVEDTIPAADLAAFYALCASRCALMLASKQAASSDSTIMADSTDFRGGEQRWRGIARELRQRYQDALHIGSTVAAAYGTGNWDAYLSRGEDRLVHSRIYR